MKAEYICKYLSVILFLAISACNDTTPTQVSVSTSEMKKSLETANRYLVRDEENDIANYIERHGLEMSVTGTGLRYQILKQGTGQPIKTGEEVSMEYELRSITGDLIYSSDNDGTKSFTVGKGQVESGLEEAMNYLHRGDVAKLIIPSHLGYGLHGDEDRIPEYATLVYTIKIEDNQ